MGTEALSFVPGLEHVLVDNTHEAVHLVDSNPVELLPIVHSNRHNVFVAQLPFRNARFHDDERWPSALPHPLLVWSELSTHPDPRVRESAERLEEEWLT